MEVRICVRLYTDISLIEAQYGELSEPHLRNDGEDSVDYYLGDEEGDDDHKWLTHDDAVRFCGFCDGAIPESSPWIMGNGEWAQSLIGLRDFSSYAMTIDEKTERLRISKIYWDYRRKGEDSRLARFSDRLSTVSIAAVT